MLALLLQIDMLEHTLRQQQQPADGQQPSSNNQQQQHHVEQQLRQQLAATEQQLARLQEEHTQYVDRTSSLLVRLQAQMQQLMRQAPGLAAAAGEAGVCIPAACAVTQQRMHATQKYEAYCLMWRQPLFLNAQPPNKNCWLCLLTHLHA